MSGRVWFICTNLFARGGWKVAGPFTTRADAMNAREAIERLTRDFTFWIDSKTVAAQADDDEAMLRSVRG